MMEPLVLQDVKQSTINQQAITKLVIVTKVTYLYVLIC